MTDAVFTVEHPYGELSPDQEQAIEHALIGFMPRSNNRVVWWFFKELAAPFIIAAAIEDPEFWASYFKRFAEQNQGRAGR